MHAYGTKSIDLAACFCAKVGLLARIWIADEVYIRTLLAAAFGNISHAAEPPRSRMAPSARTPTKSPTALALATSRTPPRSRGRVWRQAQGHPRRAQWRSLASATSRTHAAEVSYGAKLENAARAVLYGAVRGA